MFLFIIWHNKKNFKKKHKYNSPFPPNLLSLQARQNLDFIQTARDTKSTFSVAKTESFQKVAVLLLPKLNRATKTTQFQNSVVKTGVFKKFKKNCCFVFFFRWKSAFRFELSVSLYKPEQDISIL